MTMLQPSTLVTDREGTMEGATDREELSVREDLFEQQICWIEGTMKVSF